MGISDWIKEHPYLAGGGVLGIIVLFLLLRSGSSSSSAAAGAGGVGGSGLSSSDYASIQEAQLQTGAQLQAQEAAAQAQTQQTVAAQNVAQIQANAATTQTQLQGQVALQNILTAGQVQENTNTAAYQTALAQIGGQTSIAGIQAGEAEQANTTQAQTLEDEYNTAVQSQGIISQAQTQQAQITADTQQSISQQAASVQLANIAGQYGVQNNQIASTNLANTLASGVDNNQITATESVDNNSINAQTQELTTLSPILLQQLADQTNVANAEINSANAQAYWGDQAGATIAATNAGAVETTAYTNLASNLIKGLVGAGAG